MPKHVAILGGGIAGLAAAYELTKLQRAGADVSFTLIEQSGRLGGILETERHDTPHGRYIVELGPDGWVSEKPWARELAEELGLADQLLPSNDAERVTWVLRDGKLVAMPEGMRMMVPTDLKHIANCPLFTGSARAAYAAEPGRAELLRQTAPAHDESVASFVRRHFGQEVLQTIGAPLLGGIFGGDVEQLSVQAVMQPFVAMEREHGSLIRALQRKAAQTSAAPGSSSIFTSLLDGTGTLAEALAAQLPPEAVQLHRRVGNLRRSGGQWLVATEPAGVPSDLPRAEQSADHVLLALPVLQARELLQHLEPSAAALMRMHTSSAAVVALGFAPEQRVHWPKGFGFLVPPTASIGGGLLAATFCDQKYAQRASAGGRLLRAYYGGLDVDDAGNPLPRDEFRTLPFQHAFRDMQRILGPLPTPLFATTRVWPRALPQYSVGHGERMDGLASRVAELGSIHLLGNGYRGVGLPDLIRDARTAARAIAT